MLRRQAGAEFCARPHLERMAHRAVGFHLEVRAALQPGVVLDRDPRGGGGGARQRLEERLEHDEYNDRIEKFKQEIEAAWERVTGRDGHGGVWQRGPSNRLRPRTP